MTGVTIESITICRCMSALLTLYQPLTSVELVPRGTRSPWVVLLNARLPPQFR